MITDMHGELHDVILYAGIAWMLSVICWVEPVDLLSVIWYWYVWEAGDVRKSCLMCSDYFRHLHYEETVRAC